MLVLIGAFALVALVVAMIAWPLVSSGHPEVEAAPDGAVAGDDGGEPPATGTATGPGAGQRVENPLEAEIARRRAALSARRDEVAKPTDPAEVARPAEPDEPDGSHARAFPESREER